MPWLVCFAGVDKYLLIDLRSVATRSFVFWTLLWRHEHPESADPSMAADTALPLVIAATQSSPPACCLPLPCAPTGKATDVEGGMPSADAELDRIKRTIVEMEKAVAVAAPEDRAEIQKSLDELRGAAARMSEVNKLATEQAVRK